MNVMAFSRITQATQEIKSGVKKSSSRYLSKDRTANIQDSDDQYIVTRAIL